MSSLICDRWLTHKLVTFVGLTDSLERSFSCHDQRLVAAAGLDPYSEPTRRVGPSPWYVGPGAGLVANL